MISMPEKKAAPPFAGLWQVREMVKYHAP